MKYLEHFKTITYHKLLVMDGCFRLGLVYQGLMHDMSKYAPSEFIVGAKYYQGNRSPNNAEREVKGYSEAWLHHQGRNKHHYEYWLDYDENAGKGARTPVHMPRQYLAEMFVDRVSASKVYNKGNYDDSYPLAYLMKGYDKIQMHDRTKAELKFLLTMLAKNGEEYTFKYIRKKVLKNARRRENFIQWYAKYGQSYIGKLLRCVEKLGNTL